MKKATIIYLFLGIASITLFLAATLRPDIQHHTPYIIHHSPLADSLDTETGLVIDPNLNLVKAHCTGCHSPKFIIQHHFTREEWLSKIRWMQRNHKLWDLGESEKKVLDYLAKHYAPRPSAYSRREALRNVKWYKLEQ